jgi:hypothetical protein
MLGCAAHAELPLETRGNRRAPTAAGFRRPVVLGAGVTRARGMTLNDPGFWITVALGLAQVAVTVWSAKRSPERGRHRKRGG